MLRISGPDANTFIQGQITQDVRLSPGQIAYGLWLNQKGKVLADSHVLRITADESLLVSWGTPATTLQSRLEEYLIADDVAVRDETELWCAFGGWGDAVVAAFGNMLGSEVPAPGKFAQLERALLFRGRLSAAPNFIVLAPRAQQQTWVQRWRDAGATEGDELAAEAERIRSGIPTVPADIGPNDLPNEGGLDREAISYTKGCYLGQEVMSRLKNLGQVRRRLHVVRGRGAPPSPRTQLEQAGKRVGEIRSVAPEQDGFVAFAMLSLVNFAPAEPLRLHDGRALELLAHG